MSEIMFDLNFMLCNNKIILKPTPSPTKIYKTNTVVFLNNLKHTLYYCQ